MGQNSVECRQQYHLHNQLNNFFFYLSDCSPFLEGGVCGGGGMGGRGGFGEGEGVL